jgi:hypothetical protein
MSSSSTLVDNPSFGSSSQTFPSQTIDTDAKSDASFDPLFDDEPEAEPTGPPPAVAGQLLSEFVGLGNPKPTSRAIAPPKNAPPLLDAATCSALSSDVLMTASIDGQVILWDKRTPGTGVGRLWMSEKTPPWCLSVRTLPLCRHARADLSYTYRHVGPPMAGRFTLGDGTGRSTCGTRACSGSRGSLASRAS